MKKLFTLTLAAAGFMTAASAETVNVYNWSDYIDEEILAEFEAETGIKVVYDVFDSNEVLETKLLTGGTGYDVVVPSASFLARQIKAGIFQPLDRSKLSNAGNEWELIKERVEAYDPENAFSVNYMWGTTAIGYNVDAAVERLGAEPSSWDVIFDEEKISKFADCGVHILDAPTEVVPAALNYLGLDPNSTDPAEIEAATDLLLKIRPHIQKFHSSEYIEALANGDICLAVGWSGDVFIARDRAAEADNGVSVEYLVPEEGALMWFDQMAIPGDAENVENAHTFINFILRPEVIAKASNYVYYANGNLPSQELLEEDVIGDPAIYPDEATAAKLYTVLPYSPRTRRTVTRSWTKVKTGQ